MLASCRTRGFDDALRMEEGKPGLGSEGFAGNRRADTAMVALIESESEVVLKLLKLAA
jgi:hypothetical protein